MTSNYRGWVLALVLIVPRAAALQVADAGGAPAVDAPDTSDPTEREWWRLLGNLNLDFVAIDDGLGGETLGIRYEIEREISKSWELELSGNIALDSEVNPQDFLRSDIRYELASRDADSFDADWDIDLNACVGYDANQTFTQRHVRYGLDVEIISLNSGDPSQPTWWWLADYPAAALRYLSGASRDFAPTYLPNLYFGIDQIAAGGDDPRSQVGDDGDFARFYAEIEYRPIVLGIGDESQWSLDVSYRYYKELDPDAAVRAAELDEYAFLKVDFLRPEVNGFFARYVNGQLPFDLNDGEAFQIGWTLNF